LFSALQKELDQRQANGLLRRRRLLESAQGVHIRVDGQDVLSFCSNDYLGLANHPEIIAAAQDALQSAGVGGGASHLISGHHQLHHDLELALAEFVGLPRALLFSTGYMANIGAVTALVGRGNAIFADKLNHASLNDAMLLSRADIKRYAHNDMAQLEKLLAASRAERKLVLADAVFSMDGDMAPVPEMLALCERYDAWLLLDDAHGFGVLGAEGRGILHHGFCSAGDSLTPTLSRLRERGLDLLQAGPPHAFAGAGSALQRAIYMATLGKAAGVSGAFVAGDATLIETLIQNARTYIYTTATPPMLAGALLQSLEIIKNEDGRRMHLQALIAVLKGGLKLQRWQLMPSGTAIQPLVIGNNEEAISVSERLLAMGILVPAIRPPTVSANTARLRISLSAAHSLEDVARLTEALNALAGDVNVPSPSQGEG
jgi:8-amino-7-oxononanoate synthase